MTEPSSQGALQGARLSEHDLALLLDSQRQCVLTFLDAAGWPRAVVLSYLHHGGRFWLTAVEQRGHVRAVRADPRVSVVVERHDDGRQMCAQRGRAIVHEDPGTKSWFYPAFAAVHAPATAATFAHHLDTPGRVVIEIDPVGSPVTHDSRKLPGDGRGTLAEDRRET